MRKASSKTLNVIVIRSLVLSERDLDQQLRRWFVNGFAFHRQGIIQQSIAMPRPREVLVWLEGL